MGKCISKNNNKQVIVANSLPLISPKVIVNSLLTELESCNEMEQKHALLTIFPLPGVLGQKLYEYINSEPKDTYKRLLKLINPSVSTEIYKILFKICDINSDHAICEKDLNIVFNSIKIYNEKDENNAQFFQTLNPNELLTTYSKNNKSLTFKDFKLLLMKNPKFVTFFTSCFLRSLTGLTQKSLDPEEILYEKNDSQRKFPINYKLIEKILVLFNKNDFRSMIYLQNYILTLVEGQLIFSNKFNEDQFIEYVAKNDQSVNEFQSSALSQSIKTQYEFLQNIGKGKFSTVHLARKKSNDEVFAVKKVSKRFLKSHNPIIVLKELQALSVLHHDNIIRLHEFLETRKGFYFILDYCDNGTLSDYIESAHEISENTIKTIIFQLISSINYLNSLGIIHRDIKPENILISDAVSMKIKLIDFGLAIFSSELSKKQDKCGSIFYMSPEMLNSEDYTETIDLWSVGVIMFYIIKKRLPFDHEDRNMLSTMIKRAHWNMEKENWVEISELALDFLKGLLCLKEKRFEAQISLEHEWLKEFRLSS